MVAGDAAPHAQEALRAARVSVPAVDEGLAVVPGRLAEKDEADGDWINGGFFVIEPTVLTSIEGPHTSFEAEVLPRLATDGRLMAYRHEGFWHSMDTLRDVRALNALWANGAAPWKSWD